MILPVTRPASEFQLTRSPTAYFDMIIGAAFLEYRFSQSPQLRERSHKRSAQRTGPIKVLLPSGYRTKQEWSRPGYRRSSSEPATCRALTSRNAGAVGRDKWCLPGKNQCSLSYQSVPDTIV